MLRKMTLLSLLLVALLALSACSRGNKTAEEEPTAAPAVEAPAAQEEAPASEAPPTATSAPEQAQPAVVLPTPTPDGDAASGTDQRWCKF